MAEIERFCVPWRTSGRDFGTRAQHCVGARHLLCSSHSFELEIRLHHSHRFLNPDYSVFDCGGVALSEDKLSFSWEDDRSCLGRVIGKPSLTGLCKGCPLLGHNPTHRR